MEQKKDVSFQEMIDYLEKGTLPSNSRKSQKILLQSPQFEMVDDVLYYIDPRQRNHKRANAGTTPWLQTGGGKECSVM